MGGGIVESVRRLLFLAHGETALKALGKALADGEVAGRVFVEEGVVEEDAHLGDGGAGRDQGDLAEVGRALVGLEDGLEGVIARLRPEIDDLAAREPEPEAVDQAAVIVEGQGAVNGAVGAAAVGRGENLLGRHIGEKADAVGRFRAAARPAVPLRHPMVMSVPRLF